MIRMTPRKVDNLRDDEDFMMQSTEELTAYKRFLAADDDPLFVQSVVIREMKITLSKRERTLAEVSSLTDGFDTLDVTQLRALAKRHEVAWDDPTTPSKEFDDKPKIVAALRGVAGTPKMVEVLGGDPLPAGIRLVKPNPPSVVTIPDEIRTMNDADLETRAVELGCMSVKTGEWKKKDRQAKEMTVARRMAKTEPVTS